MRGWERRSFILSRTSTGAVATNTTANTAKNAAIVTHMLAPIFRSRSSAISPRPNEITNNTMAHNGVGHRHTWQFGQVTAASPEDVQSDFAGTSCLHCGQVMVLDLTDPGVGRG